MNELSESYYPIDLNSDEYFMNEHRNTISENITVPTNTNCGSFGPLEITNGTTITISNGAAWSIL